LLGHIQNGHFYDTACSLARIDYSTFKEWKQKKSAFSAAVDIANARSLDEARRKIKELSNDRRDWRGWAHLAAIKDKRYQERQELEVEGKVEGVIIYRPEKRKD
jgi:hypothetical protein